MWEILPNHADWDCFKTPILQDILRRNIVHFWKSYICSNKLDGRIRNHLFGCWIEIRRDSCSRFVWSGLFVSLETQFRFLIDRSNPLSMVTEIMDHTKDLKEWSTCWIALIVFIQTSNFRIKKHCCMCLRTTKQWLRWLSKEGVPQWDMFPGPTE